MLALRTPFFSLKDSPRWGCDDSDMPLFLLFGGWAFFLLDCHFQSPGFPRVGPNKPQEARVKGWNEGCRGLNVDAPSFSPEKTDFCWGCFPFSRPKNVLGSQVCGACAGPLGWGLLLFLALFVGAAIWAPPRLSLRGGGMGAPPPSPLEGVGWGHPPPLSLRGGGMGAPPPLSLRGGGMGAPPPLP